MEGERGIARKRGRTPIWSWSCRRLMLWKPAVWRSDVRCVVAQVVMVKNYVRVETHRLSKTDDQVKNHISRSFCMYICMFSNGNGGMGESEEESERQEKKENIKVENTIAIYLLTLVCTNLYNMQHQSNKNTTFFRSSLNFFTFFVSCCCHTTSTFAADFFFSSFRSLFTRVSSYTYSRIHTHS